MPGTLKSHTLSVGVPEIKPHHSMKQQRNSLPWHCAKFWEKNNRKPPLSIRFHSQTTHLILMCSLNSYWFGDPTNLSTIYLKQSQLVVPPGTEMSLGKFSLVEYIFHQSFKEFLQKKFQYEFEFTVKNLWNYTCKESLGSNWNNRWWCWIMFFLIHSKDVCFVSKFNTFTFIAIVAYTYFYLHICFPII